MHSKRIRPWFLDTTYPRARTALPQQPRLTTPAPKRAPSPTKHAAHPSEPVAHACLSDTRLLHCLPFRILRILHPLNPPRIASISTCDRLASLLASQS
ncbi:hypothetical protein IQ06DRAFT_293340 [Phaeosphaeriaceae sp. SRC1lsM3a]|nr:hypothetical protein IQ06DRAFT_293340 [Stagonospora sp. SRC1lsM3a]